MKPLAVLLLCLALVGSSPAVEPDRTVVVWVEEPHNGEWWVPFAVGSQYGVARCGTVEEARMVYAAMAAVMVKEER